MKLPTGIELFCGCGGLSTGFLDAGIAMVGGFDIDRRSVEAYNYNHNHRGSQGHVVDISKTTGAQLLELAGVPRVDFLLGGPPCQPFSIIGKRKGSEDARAGLVSDFVRLVEELRPDALVFENVPNLSKIEDGRVFDGFVSRLHRLGYGISHDIRAAAEYGVPQVRRRLLLVALAAGKPQLPEPTHGPPEIASGLGLTPYRTCMDALEDLPPAADFGECGVYNHEPTAHSGNMRERFAALQPGRREAGSFHDRLHPDRPSYTLRAGTGNFSPLRPVHYSADRVITVRESARLQGFSDDFIWPDWIPRLQQYRQVGNAVPPPVGKAVAEALARQLNLVIDPEPVAGRPEGRSPAITMTDDERKAQRLRRLRGASLGKAARTGA